MTTRQLLFGLVLLALLVVIPYHRVLDAGFVAYDDDVHVYANPHLNPLSLTSIGELWQHAYKGLYVPLAYTILGAIAWFARQAPQTPLGLGEVVTLSPGAFHLASVGFHVVNTWLVAWLILRLTRKREAALLAAVVFALHPLQVESVAWISELRGLTSACFALAALNLFVLARQTEPQAPARGRRELLAATACVVFAMLCKPAAAALPLVALALDRVAFGTSWRRALLTAATWAACVLPFALVTRSVQTLHPEGASLFWQRPFIAGDALCFYLWKLVVPLDLAVEYGRTPKSVMSQAWSYAAWLVPAGLLALCYRYRERRPLTWLGALLFVAFLAPALGLVPFTFQAHSTVADRYAYLALLGVGLIIGDLLGIASPRLGVRANGGLVIVLLLLSSQQTRYWDDNIEFLRHALDVNPNLAFAHNNLGSIDLKQDRPADAAVHFEKALELEPNSPKTQNNLGLALVALGRLEEAEPHYRKAVELDPHYFKAYENLGATYLRTNHFDAAIEALKAAIQVQPEAKALNDLGVAYMQNDRFDDGLATFRRAVELEPNNPQYRRNLGYALQQAGRTEEAAAYLTQ